MINWELRYYAMKNWLKLPRYDSTDAAITAIPLSGDEQKWFVVPGTIGSFTVYSVLLQARKVKGGLEVFEPAIRGGHTFLYCELNEAKRHHALELGEHLIEEGL